MKTRFLLAATAALIVSIPAFPQRGSNEQHPERQEERPRANQGRIPPAPSRQPENARREPERGERGHESNRQRVDHDHWYGRSAPNNPRFHMEHPYEHGRFRRYGPSYRYNIPHIDRRLHRFQLREGYCFEIAAWDWPLAAEWCWTCGGDGYVIYLDPDHPGWYMLYNSFTGGYVYVTYLGICG